ncbi:MAG TPA: hypothetical protein VJL89_00615 [Thermodesulfovibrionia bacterium]|nr:hypothetical protein [Thermodesulfovibrionia bacterium]
MIRTNLAVTSREYKLMLNTDRFKNRENGSKVFVELIHFLIKKEKGTILEKQNKEEKRQTFYLDTPQLALRQHGFSLRLREEAEPSNGFQINLKYRSSDRYISAGQDISSPEGGKIKFEEDILPPFVSRFSHSNSIRVDKLPELKTMKQVTALFPGLKKLNIEKDTPVKIANDFKALELVRKICKFQFGDIDIVKASLSFWYLVEDSDWPLVAEFSFDYDADDTGKERHELEQYPFEAVEGSNRFFRALQNQVGWVDFNTSTKTAFAVEVL